MFCKDCGKKVDSKSKFCWFCGTPIEHYLVQDSSVYADDPNPTPKFGLPALDSARENIALDERFKRPSNKLFRSKSIAGAIVILSVASFFLLNFNSVFPHKKKLVKVYSPTKPVSTSSTTTTVTNNSQVSSSGSSNIKTAATNLNSLLSQSGLGRTTLVSTIQGIYSCSISPSIATQSLQSVISNRRNLISQLDSSHLSGLPNPVQLRSSLNKSWLYSLKADQYFLQWEQQVINSSCHGQAKTTSAYVNAVNESQLATASKQSFLTMWNPIASQQSLPILRPSQI